MAKATITHRDGRTMPTHVIQQTPRVVTTTHGTFVLESDGQFRWVADPGVTLAVEVEH